MLATRNAAGRALSLGGIVILVLIEYQVESSHPEHVALTAAWTVVAVATWLLMTTPLSERHWLVRPFLVAVMGAAAIGMLVASPVGASIIPAIVAIVAATRVRPPANVVLAVAIIVGYVVAWALTLGLQPITLFSYVLGFSFAYLASRSTNRLREEQARTKALLAEVQRNRDAQVQAAALNERTRIAREIHDVLAHTLAALSVQLENARVILGGQASNQEAMAAVERAHHLAREGLNETRRAVSALRGDQIPGPNELKQLVDSFQRDTGIAATLRVDGTARPLDAEAQLALFRTAQEALTNIRKHARPQRVEVLVRYQSTSTQLLVTDEGETSPGPPANGGYGLIGMRERAELLGGSLDAGPTDDGFRVSLELPR
jgi:signal transduction histidine kinase